MDSTHELDERQRRAAINQSRFRGRNEALRVQLDTSELSEFVCECAQMTCEIPVLLSAREYEQVRRIPTYFVVAVGHVLPDVERVVHQKARYEVVEKIEDAAKVAIRLDPRPRWSRP
jgi:hypothetical protein